MERKKAVVIAFLVFVYIFSSIVSYAVFSGRKSGKNEIKTSVSSIPSSVKNGQVVFNNDLPKTEECPLNGVKYSISQKEWWQKHRPLGVMIENHKEARPQSGLSYADIVYEAVAEGGITRFLALYYCQDGGQLGPIRSARTYFVDFISEYGNDPLYVHVGGANTPGPANALGQISDYGWSGYNDMNQFSIGFPTFWRDYDRLGHPADTEHTMYSTTDKLWKFAATRGLTNVDKEEISWDKGFTGYSFTDEEKISESKTQSVHLEFWSADSDYFVDWVYNPTVNSYVRSVGGVQHIDRDNNKALSAKNLVTLFMQESHANDGYENNAHLLYKTKGTGKAFIFMNGVKIEGTWRKTSRTYKTLIFDSNGNPIKFNRGTIWFSILPTDGILTVK